MQTKVVSMTGTLLKQRMLIKRVVDAHKFLNKQYDNTWKVYDGLLVAGTYAYVGGNWVNIRKLDPCLLAHV